MFEKTPLTMHRRKRGGYPDNQDECLVHSSTSIGELLEVARSDVIQYPDYEYVIRYDGTDDEILVFSKDGVKE